MFRRSGRKCRRPLAISADLRSLRPAHSARLGDLGLPASELERHIAWDIGIAGVAERLAKHLDAHLVAQRYSRLVIDCNRPPCVASSIPVISEATTIPGNEGLDARGGRGAAQIDFRSVSSAHCRSDRSAVARGRPDGAGVAAQLHAGLCRRRRPWHIGTLYHRDTKLPPLLLRLFRAEGDLVVGDNEPYAVSDATDYTIPVHGEARGLMNSGIEIRQDLIADQSGQTQWADRLARILREVEATLIKPRASHCRRAICIAPDQRSA